MNFCLRKNLFSLKNLTKLKSGRLVIYLKKIISILKDHIIKCEVI